MVRNENDAQAENGLAITFRQRTNVLWMETADAVGLAVTVEAMPTVPCYPEELGTGGHRAHTVLTSSCHYVGLLNCCLLGLH